MCKPVPEGSELEDSDDDMLNEVDTKWERSITMPPAIGMAWACPSPKLSLRPSNGELPGYHLSHLGSDPVGADRALMNHAKVSSCVLYMSCSGQQQPQRERGVAKWVSEGAATSFGSD